MNAKSIEKIKNGLKSRHEKFNNTDEKNIPGFYRNIIGFHSYINRNSIIKSYIYKLKSTQTVDECFKHITQKNCKIDNYLEKISYLYANEEELALLSWMLLNYVLNIKYKRLYEWSNEIYEIAGKWQPDYNVGVLTIMNLIIDTLFHYLYENLEDFGVTNYFLEQYKQRTEWFNSNKLKCVIKKEAIRIERAKAKEEKSKAQYEKLLVLDVYEYLFDCGIEFYIEPSSIKGEVDFITAQKYKDKDDDRIVCDAKKFDGKKESLKGSFNQVYNYLEKWKTQMGYVLIYNMSKDKRLIFEFGKYEGVLPYIEKNNRRVYYIEVWLNIAEYSSSEIKVENISITKEYLSKEIKE